MKAKKETPTDRRGDGGQENTAATATVARNGEDEKPCMRAQMNC